MTRYIAAVLWLAASILPASTDPWTLKSGPVEYRLRQQSGALRLDYFGPSGMAPWPRRAVPSFDISGLVEGLPVAPEDLELVSHDAPSSRPGVESLRLVYRHRQLPLRAGSDVLLVGGNRCPHPVPEDREHRRPATPDRNFARALVASPAWRL